MDYESDFDSLNRFFRFFRGEKNWQFSKSDESCLPYTFPSMFCLPVLIFYITFHISNNFIIWEVMNIVFFLKNSLLSRSRKFCNNDVMVTWHVIDQWSLTSSLSFILFRPHWPNSKRASGQSESGLALPDTQLIGRKLENLEIHLAIYFFH